MSVRVPCLLPCLPTRFSTMCNGYYILCTIELETPQIPMDECMQEPRPTAAHWRSIIDVVRLGQWMLPRGKLGWNLQPRHPFASHGDPRRQDCQRWHKECSMLFGRAWQATSA
jgi:hypothetical protein